MHPIGHPVEPKPLHQALQKEAIVQLGFPLGAVGSLGPEAKEAEREGLEGQGTGGEQGKEKRKKAHNLILAALTPGELGKG
jgi:hypothetical protein